MRLFFESLSWLFLLVSHQLKKQMSKECMPIKVRFLTTTPLQEHLNAQSKLGYYQNTVKLSYNEQLGTGHFCSL